MARYERVSGTLFALIAVAQLARAVLGLPAPSGHTCYSCLVLVCRVRCYSLVGGVGISLHAGRRLTSA